MILRRFIKHVTEQNWFAVGLDVLVVITGIFLGMQVTEWNENRKTAAEEKEYLMLLHRDIQSIGVSFQDQERFEGNIIRYSDMVAQIVDEGDISEKRRIFSRLLSLIAARKTARIEKAAFSDLQSSGKLKIIGNGEVREEIIRFFEDVERTALIVEKNGSHGADVNFTPYLIEAGFEPQVWDEDMDADLRHSFDDGQFSKSISGVYDRLIDLDGNPVFDLTSSDPFWSELKRRMAWRVRTATSSRFISGKAAGDAAVLATRLEHYMGTLP